MSLIKSIGDILKGINNGVIGSGGIGSTYNNNNLSTIVAGRGANINSKLFNQLMQFDRHTCAQVQPFVGGRFIAIPGQMAPIMERLHPEATNYMRVLITSTVIGVDGFEDNTLEVETVTALTEQNSYPVITKASGSTKSITLTFMTIFQGLPIFRYVTAWMNYVQNRGSGFSSYPHLTEQTAGGALEYHEGNHTMNMVYIVPDPSGRFVETGAFIYAMMPTNNQSNLVLNQTWGESSPKQLQIPFKCIVITDQHDGVRSILTGALKEWTKNIALDDNQVVINSLLS